MFTITGITSIVITFIVSFKKGQWWQKGIYSCSLKAISDASLCILCTAFLQKLYFARVSHGMVQFVLKIAHLSILMERTLLLERRQLQYPTTFLGAVPSLLVRNRMYTWLNKRIVFVLNISNKQRKKLTTLLVQIDRKRSQVEAARLCWCTSPCKNELVSVSSWHKWLMK